MSVFKSSALALAILGTAAAMPAQAEPVASAVSVVSFENFQVFWSSGAQSGAQVSAGDFSSLSVDSSMLTAANMTGQTGISMNPSSSTGADLVATSALGTIPGSITGYPATATTVFNVPTMPMVGNFSLSMSNETGAPINGFESAAPSADLHNASYASLDTLVGTAGTSTSSRLASTMILDANQSGGLTFEFDLGNYIAAFLSSGAAQTASAGWSVGLTLVDLTAGGNPIVFYSVGDEISNNFPGTGTTVTGVANSALTGGLLDLTSVTVPTNTDIIGGHRYQFTATISTRTQVERVSIPEPATMGLLGLGLAAVGLMARRREPS